MSLSRIETLFWAERGTTYGDELELWLRLVDAYEEQHFPINVGESSSE